MRVRNQIGVLIVLLIMGMMICPNLGNAASQMIFAETKPGSVITKSLDDTSSIVVTKWLGDEGHPLGRSGTMHYSTLFDVTNE